MDRPHRVLEKKLHELEVRFTYLFFPDDDDAHRADTADHQTLSREIQARVDFLQNLLAIEKDCHPQDHAPSSHLLDLERRLHGLNAAFHDWMAGPDDHVRPNTNDQVLPDEDITVDCSCTRSCFSSDNDDDDKAQEDASDIADSDCFELDIKEDPINLDINTSDDQQTVEGEQLETQEYNRRPKSSLLSRFLALAGAAAAVSVGVTVLISQVLGGFQDEVFLVPT